MKKIFNKIFAVEKPIIGMVHVHAMPATPAFGGSIQEVIDLALQDAMVLKLGGVDAIMIENMHDVPYVKNDVGPEVTALMSVVAHEIKKTVNLPCGIQILAAANEAAFAVAKAAGFEFVRAEGFVFGHLADEGWIDSNAGALLRYRKKIDANDVLIFTDIKKKHSSHTITSDISLEETAKTAEYFRSDGVIITGTSTGRATDLEEIKKVKSNCNIPVLVGSGVTLENVENYLAVSDALIVGSYFKKEGHWKNEVEYERVVRFMEKCNV